MNCIARTDDGFLLSYSGEGSFDEDGLTMFFAEAAEDYELGRGPITSLHPRDVVVWSAVEIALRGAQYRAD